MARVMELRTSYGLMALLLTEFIEAKVEDNPEILHQKQSDIYLDIDDM